MRPIRFGVHIHVEGSAATVVEKVRLAEELGYDSVWVGDSQLIMPEPFTQLAACVFNTKRIILGVGITNTRTRHPTVTASALAALADLAPGRVAAAFGVGGSSHGSLGWKKDRLADYRRNFELIAGLLQGERVVHNGRELKLVWATPERTRQVCLYVHAGGPRGQHQAGEMGYPVTIPGQPQKLPEALKRINAGAATIGKTVQELGVCWWATMAISDDWEAIKEHMAASLSVNMRRRYQDFLQGDLGADELGVEMELARSINQEFSHVEHAISGSRPAQLLLEQPDELWKEWLKPYLAGTPEKIVERLRQALQHEAISEVVVQPRLSTERLPVEAVMEAFAKQVRPFLSGN